MKPSRAECERTLRSGTADVVAMSVFAGGLIPPREAVDYLEALPQIRSVVFGASTAEHLRETRELLRFLG